MLLIGKRWIFIFYKLAIKMVITLSAWASPVVQMVRKVRWSRKWQPTPVFLPGESHGQRRLVGYSPWGCRRVGHNLAAKQ